ncbi:phosphotransferase family protein [Actinokineospora sp. NBRC 105648]|uniref:phosphotransferase family protein n=1 Tax=Actinokineospora sp. NBRC 105648 TaxID=3032206 RepID=UPI0024A3D215|nr:phosphotransferase family protein [Actinokineospora sp. NBRC 105648]GLZ42893.1 acyl-CoA dehydrogenase [Actinokineospora sp. NBRC 105648]
MDPLGLTPAVSDWLATALPAARPPFTFTRITGGRSNLTYLVADASGVRRVLRRPPLGEHPANAHDVLREARLLTALRGAVPVPEVLAICSDVEVTGAPFVMLEYLDGLVLRDPSSVQSGLSVVDCAVVGPAVVDALAALHSVDPARAGLGTLADRRDYLPRQLRRWHDNWTRTATRPLPDLARAHDRLVELAPEQLRTGIVHGDFRLDNCLLDRTGTVLGVLDWELTTVGDPLADLGQFLVYWAEPGDSYTALHNPPTVVPGFATRAELAARYFTQLDLAPVSVDYYLAFNWWKTACIVENVYTRMAAGAMGTTERRPASFAAQASALATQAWRSAADLG